MVSDMNEVKIEDVLVNGATVLDVEPFANKDCMFEFMSGKLQEAGIVIDKDKYINSLYARENIGSTFMGNFIAIPHGKCKEVLKPGIAFCRCKTPFIYESFGESGLVKYIFMFAISNEQESEDYLRVLAALATLLVHDDFLKKLEQCFSYEEIVDLIKEFRK